MLVEKALGFAMFKSELVNGDGMNFNSFNTIGSKMFPSAKLRSITVGMPDKNAFVAADWLKLN
jgi:hypothetical protein